MDRAHEPTGRMSAAPTSRASLAGTTVVITGAGRGIGLAVARRLGSAGARLALCARTDEELAAAAVEIGNAAAAARPEGPLHVEILAQACDVSRSDEVSRFAEAVRERFGVPRVVINNAGIVERGRLDEQDPAEWRQVVEVNLFGTYLVTRAFLAGMRLERAGRVINVASISGRQGTPRLTAYCAAKHAVVGLTRALAEEVRGDGIQVNAVCPGSVDTQMLVGSGFAPAMSADDVAGVIHYLAAEAPPALTGACLDVFG